MIVFIHQHKVDLTFLNKITVKDFVVNKFQIILETKWYIILNLCLKNIFKII